MGVTFCAHRFSERFPQPPVLPTIGLSPGSLQCTLEEDDSVPNLTRRTPLYQLHSSHFRTSPIDEETGEEIVSRTVVAFGEKEDSTAAGGGRRNWAHRPESGPPPPPPAVFSTKIFLESFDANVLRTAFLFLDLLVLAYRCTLTYVTARTIHRRFSSCAPPQGQQNKKDFRPWQGPPPAEGNRPGEAIGGGDRRVLTAGHHPATTMTTMVQDGNISNQNNVYVTDPQTLAIKHISSLQTQTGLGPAGVKTTTTTTGPGESSAPTKGQAEELGYTTMRSVFERLIENEAFPKVIILAMLVVLVYVFLRIMTVVLDVRFLVGVRVFGVYVNVLGVQANQTNFYVVDQARFFNEVTMKTFEAQVNTELANLQSMIDFFNDGKKNLF